MQDKHKPERGSALFLALILSLILGGAALIWALSLDQARADLADKAGDFEASTERTEAERETLKARLTELQGESRDKLSELSSLRRERDRIVRQLEQTRSEIKEERSLRLALTAEAKLESDPKLAIRLAHEAMLSASTPAARSALLAAILADRELASFSDITDFVASKNGNLLAVRSKTEVLLVDARSGQVLARRTSENPNGLMAFSEDDKYLVAVVTVIKALVIDIETFADVSSVEVDSVVTHLSFSPAGTELLLATADRAAWLFDMKTGQRKAVFVGHGGSVSRAFFSDERTVATFASDNVLRFFDVESAEKLREIGGTGLAQQTLPILAPKVNRLLLVDRGNNHVDVVNVELGEIEFSTAIGPYFSLDATGTKLLWGGKPDQKSIQSLDLLGDGESVLFQDLDGGDLLHLDARGFLTRKNKKINLSVPGDASEGSHLEVNADPASRYGISPGGSLTFSKPGTLELVQVDGNEVAMALGQRLSRKHEVVAADEVAVFLDQAGLLTLFSTRSSAANLFASPKNPVPSPGPTMEFMSPDETRFLICDQDGSARLFDSLTGELKLTVARRGQAVVGAAFSRDGETLVLGLTKESPENRESPVADNPSEEEKSEEAAPNLLVYKAKTAEIIHEVHLPEVEFAAGQGRNLDLSPDGQLIALLNRGSAYIRTWRDGSLNQQVWSWGFSRSLNFSTSGQLVFVDGFNPRVCDPFNGEVKREVRTSKTCVASALTQDEKLVVTLELDGSLRAWSVEDGSIAHYFGGSDDPIKSFSLGTDPDLVAAVAADGSCRLYDLKASKIRRRWQPELAADSIVLSQSGEFAAVVFKASQGLEIFAVADGSSILRMKDVEVFALQILDDAEFVFVTDSTFRVTRTPFDPMKLRAGRELPRLSAEELSRFGLTDKNAED